jgi:hypothetical protein
MFAKRDTQQRNLPQSARGPNQTLQPITAMSAFDRAGDIRCGRGGGAPALGRATGTSGSADGLQLIESVREATHEQD